MPHPNDSYFARRRRKAERLEGGSMQVIGGKNRPDALLAPGIDFIFEHGIQQEAGERVIDTGFDFVPNVPTRLNGRKYIGENTARELGKLIGMVDGDEARRIQDEFDTYRAMVQRVFGQLTNASKEIADVLSETQTNSNNVSITPPPDAEAGANIAQQRAEAEVATIAAAERTKEVAANG